MKKKEIAKIILLNIGVLCITAASLSGRHHGPPPIHLPNDIDSLKSIKIGDHLMFGRYEQDDHRQNGKEEIEWKVLARNKNMLLITSRYILDCKSYHDIPCNVTWEDCSLRTWLNTNFLNAAFNNEEQKLITSTNVSADPNYVFPHSKTTETKDKIFLLGVGETKKYFNTVASIRCKPTAYAIAKGMIRYKEGYLCT